MKPTAERGRDYWSAARNAAIAACVSALGVLPLAASGPAGLVITALDADGRPLGGDRLEWWLDDGRRHKQILHCGSTSCSDWELPAAAAATSAIHVALLRRHGPGCWDEHRGRLAPVEEISGTVDRARKQTVNLHYVGTVCT